MKIINAFSRSRASALPTLLLSFAAAAGLFGGRLEAKEGDAPPPPATPLRQENTPGDKTQADTGAQKESPHSFWKHPDYDAVLEVWTDPVTGVHGKIAWLNPDDKKIRKIVGKILKKDEKLVSAKDVLSFQGMEGDLHLHTEATNKWAGSIYWPFKKKSYGLDIEQGAEKLHVHGYLLLPQILGISLPEIGKSVDLVPAKIPAPTVLALAPEVLKP